MKNSDELRQDIEYRLEMADAKPTPQAVSSMELLIKQQVLEARINELENLPTRARILENGLRMEYVGMDAVYDRIVALKEEKQ